LQGACLRLPAQAGSQAKPAGFRAEDLSNNGWQPFGLPANGFLQYAGKPFASRPTQMTPALRETKD
jgi:hypothetical protein